MKALTHWKVFVMLTGMAFLCSSCVTMFPRRHHPHPPHHEAPPPPPPHHRPEHRPEHRPPHGHRNGHYRSIAILMPQDMTYPEATIEKRGKT